jgi:hypothetical protein
MPQPPSFGQGPADLLLRGLAALAGESATTVWGINDRLVAGERALALGQLRDVLLQSQRIFIHDGNVAYERRSQKDGNRLVPLMVGDRLLPTATAHLSNLVHCAMPGKDGLVTYQLPGKVASEVLNSEVTREQLPRVSYYSRRPVFNKDFALCGPGYSAADGLLVHGEAIEPVLWEPPGPSGRLTACRRGCAACCGTSSLTARPTWSTPWPCR